MDVLGSTSIALATGKAIIFSFIEMRKASVSVLCWLTLAPVNLDVPCGMQYEYYRHDSQT